MFYIAIVKGTEIKYPEHYEEKIGLDRRAVGLKTQAMLEGEGWGLYTGQEPYECFLARCNTVQQTDETEDAYQSRVETAVQDAAKTTTSILTPTMPDDSKMDNGGETE